MTKALSIAELAAMAADTEDQTVVSTVTYDDAPPKAGLTVGRFIEYIETGKHPQKDYQGKPKPPADFVRVTFELLHPTNNITEYEHEGEKKLRAQYVTLRLPKKLSDKAKFKKLFNTMTYGRSEIKHMAQMLGEAFLINIYHNVTKVDGKDVTYVNLDKDGVYGIGAPFKVDALEGTRQAYDIREAIRPLRLFLWDNPTKETWDSLFIEGTREVKKDGGAVEQVSKNWLQELIMSAVNFSGSALDQLLGGVADLPASEEEVETAEPEELEEIEAPPFIPDEPKKPAAKPVAAKPAAKAAAPAAKADTSADDALASLGLVG